MHDKNYNEYNLDNKNEPKKKLSKETHKKEINIGEIILNIISLKELMI